MIFKIQINEDEDFKADVPDTLFPLFRKCLGSFENSISFTKIYKDYCLTLDVLIDDKNQFYSFKLHKIFDMDRRFSRSFLLGTLPKYVSSESEWNAALKMVEKIDTGNE